LEKVQDRYVLNKSFSHRKIRVKAIPNTPVGESCNVSKESTREVEEDRKMALQAAIVRVLKTRREILQNALQVEVQEMLKNQFVPSSTMLKTNIDILVQKEYLKRGESNDQLLIYVA
jgi:hypothetical protein